MLIPPTKRTTPAQWTVVAWTIIALLILMGVAAFYFAFQADLPEQVASLHRIGFWSFGLAGFVWMIKRLIAMFVD